MSDGHPYRGTGDKMKKCMEALIITISLLLFGCASTNPRNSGTKTTEAEKVASKISDTRETVEKQLSNDEKEIYNYVFAVLLRNNSSRVSVENGQVSEIPATKIVVSNITSSRIDVKEGYEKSSANYKYYFAGKMNSNYLSAFDSFIENNKTFNNIADFIKSDNRIISLEELTSRMEKASGVSDYWDNFYKTAPEACGKLSVSNIGFNPANDIAIIEISFRKSGWSGYTNYLVFGKKNTGWKVIDVLQTVVS